MATNKGPTLRELEDESSIGVYVDKELGPIDVHPNMKRYEMWKVLKWAFSEIVSLRSREYPP